MKTTNRFALPGIALACGVCLAGSAVPADAVGQRFAGSDMGPLRGEFNLYAGLAVPVGDFHEHVDLGGGAGVGGVLFLDDAGLIGLRAEGGFIVYGTETARVPWSLTVPFVDVDVRTTNSILAAGLGPQISLGQGPIRPYVYGTVGFSYFFTETSVEAQYDTEPIASTTNFGDFQLAFTGGGGLAVRVRGGENPLSLDLSASYQHNGLTEYLANGADNLVRGRRGEWWADPILGDANLITYRIGITIGVR